MRRLRDGGRRKGRGGAGGKGEGWVTQEGEREGRGFHKGRDCPADGTRKQEAGSRVVVVVGGTGGRTRRNAPPLHARRLFGSPSDPAENNGSTRRVVSRRVHLQVSALRGVHGSTQLAACWRSRASSTTASHEARSGTSRLSCGFSKRRTKCRKQDGGRALALALGEERIGGPEGGQQAGIGGGRVRAREKREGREELEGLLSDGRE